MASFFVRAHRSGRWSLMEQAYDACKSIQTPVDKSAYFNLGFSPDWPVEKAKERCRLLNAQEKLKRKESHKIAAIGKRVEDMKLMTSLYTPRPLIEEFWGILKARTFGSEKHQSRIYSHWRTTMDMLNELKLGPHEYGDNKEQFYRNFIENCRSPDYVSKLLRIINMYGVFACKKLRLPYEPIPNPDAHISNRIADAYLDSEGFIGPSDPLTPRLLAEKQEKLKEKCYIWMHISLWFGLRPSEVDGFYNPNTWNITQLDGKDVLHVYQPKLTMILRVKRWKHIPVLYKEQATALAYIKAQSFKRPTRDALKTIFDKNFITTYAGRKGFVRLMFEHKQPVEAVSSWMGHQDISTTWREYRDMEQVLLGKKPRS